MEGAPVEDAKLMWRVRFTCSDLLREWSSALNSSTAVLIAATDLISERVGLEQ